MATPVVSVIIPMYNCKRYIEKCLESLIAQSLTEFEIIVVNDGSTDGSEHIVTAFIEKNKTQNIRLLSKPNGGISSARNMGIDEAKGEWLAFVDADDWVEPDYLKSMIDQLKKYPADFCIAGFRKYIENTGEMRDSYSPAFYYGSRETSIEKFCYTAAYSRLYSRDIVVKNNLRYDVRILYGEDRAFNFTYLSFVKNCLVLNDKKYIYRIREGSQTQKLVMPSMLKHTFESARAFWLSFPDASAINNAFFSSYHLAQSLLASLLYEIINITLDKQDRFNEVVNDPVAVWIIHNFHFSQSELKEKLLVFLLKNRLHLLTKVIIRIYYSESIHKTAKKLLDIIK